MKDAAPRISVKGVWKVFGRDPHRVMGSEWRDKTKAEIQGEAGCVVALKDVSFDVVEGEIFVVMGLSGCGKSTLVRCLIRLIEPTQGQILVDGEDVLEYGEPELIHLRRKKVAMVFQRFGLLPHRRVIDNVTLGLEIQGVGKAERMRVAGDVLETVGLIGWEGSYARELSGGMQQRVGLARALAVNPEILLMDEPFSALDPLIRRKIQDDLIELQKQLRKTTVFITHDLHEALKLGDRIAIMRDGEVVQIGTPEQIVMAPEDDYASEFIQDVRKEAVLKARNVMREPLTVASSQEGPCCKVDSPLEELIPLLMEYHQPIPVLDGEDRLVGEVHRADVMAVIAPVGAVRQNMEEEIADV